MFSLLRVKQKALTCRQKGEQREGSPSWQETEFTTGSPSHGQQSATREVVAGVSTTTLSNERDKRRKEERKEGERRRKQQQRQKEKEDKEEGERGS